MYPVPSVIGTRPVNRGVYPLLFGLYIFLTLNSSVHAQNPAITIKVDANANKKAISPFIYGLAFPTNAQTTDLNCPLNRSGGNTTTRYNWKLNADNKGQDWFFESLAYPSAIAGEGADTFIGNNKQLGAASMITIPLIEWVARLGANRGKLSSFSIAKYGAQQNSDSQWFPDAGNGVKTNGSFVTGNNPKDANTASNSTFQQNWVKHIVQKWGAANSGGVRYYMMDNESSIWFSTHRDVRPIGLKMDEMRDKIIDYAGKIKAVDSTALIVGPEEWGWSGYLLSGFDQQYGNLHGWANLPDKTAHGNQDYMPYLLSELHKNEVSSGQRLLDVFSLHFYPQGGEFSNDTSNTMKLRRNRSTRSLWDANYVDETWIGTQVQLIPRMKQWVASSYPGLQTAITEYNWGAEGSINGATAQADILGIFGREGLDMATRWMTPDASTPTYKAMKMFRNYDGFKSGFGDTSVQAIVPNPDNVSAFAAIRTVDGALTVMVISKYLSGNTKTTLSLANFAHNGSAQVYQLTAANTILHLSDIAVVGSSLAVTVPPQSITLYVFPPAGVSNTFTSSAIASPSSISTGTQTTLSVKVKCTAGALTNGIVDVEIYDPNGVLVAQEFYAGQNFAVGKSITYKPVWTASGASGKYTVAVGVFGANWTPNYHWRTSVTTITVTSSDTSQYNFEGGAQGWVSSGGMISGVATSSVQVFAGAKSLAVTFNGSGADAQQVLVSAPATPAGKTITFHLWFPSGSAISAIQPYALEGAGGGWAWTGNWQSTANLTPNAWNTITVTLPANAVTPLDQIGVQFFTSGAWTGTCYVDTVGW